MAITAVAALYRVRIADRGATTVAGNVALTLALADMTEVPIISGPSVDLLGGSSTTHPFDLDCIVDTVLFTSSNRFAAIGRLVEIQRSEDDGGSWTTLATGRLSRVSEPDGRGKVTLSVSDERWAERDTEIFREGSTVQVFPPGLDAAWMNLPAAGTETFVVLEVDGNAAKIAATRMATPSKTLKVPRSLRNLIAEDMVPLQDIDNSNTSPGNFTALSFRYNSLDNAVINFGNRLGGLITRSTILGALRPAGTGILNTAWINFGAGHGLTADDEITGRFNFTSDVRVNENVPLHIGGTAGIHPMTLLKNILDGDYGGQAVLYDSTAMTTLEGLDVPPVWVRVTEPVDRKSWLEKHIYQPYGVAPLVGTDLALRPTSLHMPQDITIASLTTLTAANASIPTWDHTSRDLVNVIEFSSLAVEKLSETAERGDDWPVDELDTVRQRVRDITHDNTATLGEIAKAYDIDLILSDENDGYTPFNDVATQLADALFNVFGDGPERGEITVDYGESVQVGDHVILDQDTLKGFNPDTGDRTGDRLALLTSFVRRTPSSTTFEYLGLGPDSAALAAPTVSIAQNGTDADLVDVTISSLPAGATAVVQVDTGTVTPTNYRYTRSGVGNETVSFRVGAGSGTAYCRAKSVSPHRIESAWATDTVALSTRPTFTSTSVSRLFTTAEVSWTAPAETLGVRTDYDIHDRGTAPTIDATNQADYDVDDGGFTISGFTSQRQMVTVRLTPYTGWTGSAVSGTAGDPVDLQGVLRKIGGRIFLARFSTPSAAVTFDANGNAVVAVTADEEAANVYITVGDGSSPSDPTAAANDGSVAGRSGTIATSSKITTGNDAYVKIVAADADGNLSPVTEVREAHRLGPFHKDTSTRSNTTETLTTLQTITVPANSLGTDGEIHMEALFALTLVAGGATIDVDFNGVGILTESVPSAASFADLFVRLMNDGGTGSQYWSWRLVMDDGTIIAGQTTTSVDTTADRDIDINGDVDSAGDTIALDYSTARYMGTS